MMTGTGINIDLHRRMVRVTIVVGDPPKPIAEVELYPSKARELARLVRAGADFLAAIEPAEGSA